MGILGDASPDTAVGGLPSHKSGVGKRNRNNGVSSNNRYGSVTDAFVQRQEVKDLASMNRVPEFKS